MTAHVALHPDTAPGATVICAECSLDRPFPRTAPAQTYAADHNRLRHAYPEHTLDLGDQA